MKISGALAFLVVLLLLTFMGHAAESEPIGVVKSVKNKVQVVRKEKTIIAVSEMTIWNGDAIKTGPRGSIGLVFSDDTIISMGPDSELVIESFLFEPLEGKLSFFARMIRGTISFITGQIAKLSPGSARIETPHATIGMRGTHVLAKVGGK